MVDARLVARSFGAAADRYEHAAIVQRKAAERLLARAQTLEGAILDAGCGTGFLARALCRPDRQVIGLDLAAGMLARAREHLSGQPHSLCWLQADMARLPLAAGSLDGVVSNFALQWLPDPTVFFRESARVLRPGGRVLVTTLLPGTLGEMERAWKQADPEGVHVNRFAPEEQVTGGLEQAGLKMTWRQTQAEVCHYPDARTGARAVKDVGAHNMNPGRPARLTGKARWQAFEHAWEQVRTARGLPLTYHVLFLEAIKR